MKQLTTLIIVTLILTSCSNGKIEYRQGCPDYPSPDGWYEGKDAKGVYLVNKSETKKIAFTIKKTEFYKSEFDKTEGKGEVETRVYTLNPGEEKNLTCNNIISERGIIKAFRRKEFEIVGELAVSQ